MSHRVVVTGMGVIAPNGHGLSAYEQALREGRSGIRFIPKLEEMKFGCQVAGVPQNVEEIQSKYFSEEDLIAMNPNMIYAGIAGIDCYEDAGFSCPSRDSEVDWDTGAIIGTGIGGIDTIVEKMMPKVSVGKVRRVGSTMVEQIMCSSVSAKLGGLLGLGGQVTTNSSACTTGSEAIAEAFFKIREGRILRMIAGGSEGSNPYIWSGFDGMRVLNTRSNTEPERASRPMSASAAGFVPGSGAGLLMLEDLESAQARGTRIYAEILSANVNSGGHRNGGSMTAPNPEGVVRCIRGAMSMAEIESSDVDSINGHLTATMADPKEIANWAHALEVSPEQVPKVNSTKSMVGHGLGAAGGLETVAVVLQLHKRFLHGSLNCEDVHADIQEAADSIVHKTEKFSGKIIAKSSFGFGDVNASLIFKRWD